MASVDNRNLPDELAEIAQEDARARSPRTLARWVKKGPPLPLLTLLRSEAGRAQLLRWVSEYAQQDQQQAA